MSSFKVHDFQDAVSGTMYSFWFDELGKTTCYLEFVGNGGKIWVFYRYFWQVGAASTSSDDRFEVSPEMAARLASFRTADFDKLRKLATVIQNMDQFVELAMATETSYFGDTFHDVCVAFHCLRAQDLKYRDYLNSLPKDEELREMLRMVEKISCHYTLGTEVDVHKFVSFELEARVLDHAGE